MYYFFLITKGDVENSVNKKDYQRSILRNLLYISQFILGQLDHVPIILINSYSLAIGWLGIIVGWLGLKNGWGPAVPGWAWVNLSLHKSVC